MSEYQKTPKEIAIEKYTFYNKKYKDAFITQKKLRERPYPRQCTMLSKKDFYPEVEYTFEELQSRLTPEQYFCTQEFGNEWPNTGIYRTHNETGFYNCIICNTNLFCYYDKRNENVMHATFTESNATNIAEFLDVSYHRLRVECRCINCGSHLGHIYPERMGNFRYEINSASLNFTLKENHPGI